MSFTQQSDGLYHVPIVALGERLRDNFGLTIREHSHFDPVDPVHSKNSYHYYDEAIDVQDWRDDVIDGVGWKDRTANLRNLMRGAGAEVLGPGDSGHDSHLHLAAKGGIFKLNQQQYDTLFGGGAGGKGATFSSFSSPTTPHQADNPQPVPGSDSSGPKLNQVEAKTRAQDYSKMSKAQLDSAYDAMRSDPAKAREEGMKMHKAFFGKK